MSQSTFFKFTKVLANGEERVSKWCKWRRFIAWVLLYKLKLLNQLKGIKQQKRTERYTKGNYISSSLITLELMQEAEIEIIKSTQRRSFKNEIDALKSGNVISKSSKVHKLDPFVDNDGVLRAGGRIQKSSLNKEIQHPVLLPKESRVTTMIIQWCHEKVAHSGRGITINQIRSSGFWVINCNSVVKSFVSACVACRHLRGKFQQQKMTNLPKDRMCEGPPFTYCGVDLFGSFFVKEGRKEMKRYGTLFTCLSSRAVHIDKSNSLSTDSFILCLRRFIGQRGNVKHIRSDNGSNFVGASAELQKAFEEMNQEQIENFMKENGGEWMRWKRNPPSASNMGGVWECQIRSTRNILASILKTHGASLNDESLQTLLVEVEAIINSRPLTTDLLNHVDSLIPLSPINLLTMKSKVVMPPPGAFSPPDVYSRKHWRRVQHISNEFWSRWRKEVLVILQNRQKWNTVKRNCKIGDVVLLKETSTERNRWPMARIAETYADKNGIVRSVKLKLGSSNKVDKSVRYLQ